MRFLIVLLAMMSVATTAMAEKDETTVYVRNHSCKSLFSDKIDVHVYDSHNSHCTHTWVKGIKKGHSKQVTLKIDKCRYIAEAAGTVMGKREFNPKEDAEFNCYSNDLGTCGCSPYLDGPPAGYRPSEHGGWTE